MNLDFSSQESNRRSILALSNPDTIPSLLDLSHSDIVPSQPDMQIDLGLDVDTKPHAEAEAAMEEERDPLYFCENVVLKAEDRIFSIPRSGLIEHGTYFESLLNANQGITSGSVSDAGSSEKHPIVLDGVSKIHFHNFLRIIYPFRGIDPPSGDEHWLGILDLATKWGFHEIKETALTRLDHIFTSSSYYRDPVRALYLCQKYDIRQHIRHQYEALITSITPLDRPAMLAGGIDEETILNLMQLREKWFCGLVWGEKGSKTGFGGLLPCRVSARKIVEDHFSGSGSIVHDNAVEDTRIKEEVSRLNLSVKHLEEMESALIEAVREKRLAEAKAEAEKQRAEEEVAEAEAMKRMAEEEAEHRREYEAYLAEEEAKDEAARAAAEETEKQLERELKEMEAAAAAEENGEGDKQRQQPEGDLVDLSSPVAAKGEAEGRGEGGEGGDDNLDDIVSVKSDMTNLPSSYAGFRLDKMLTTRAQMMQLEDQINELQKQGVDASKARLAKLESVLEKYQRKVVKMYAAGTEMAVFADIEEDVINLEHWNEDKSVNKIEERLEKMLSPNSRSLVFTIVLGPKKNNAGKQRLAVTETTEYYNLLKYSVEDSRNRKITNINVPENKFGEWLAGYRRLKAERERQAELEQDHWS